MASYHFACPYCSGEFEVVAPELGQAIACPHCAQSVTLPAELPPPPPDFLSGDEQAETAPYAFLSEQSPVPATSQANSRPTNRPVSQSSGRPSLSRHERDRRRGVRNVILMVIGTVVLVAAALLLSRL
jgi:hypothetical protein